MKDFFKCVAFALVMLAAIVLFMGVPMATGDYYSCKAKAGKMKMKWSWGVIEDCMIEYAPGKWVSMDKYRVVEK